jgi:flagellum-specific peptidoglycan hydrolase FlgJ
MIAGLKYVDAFINKIAQTAQSVARKWKVPASIVIAQAALETNGGARSKVMPILASNKGQVPEKQ